MYALRILNALAEELETVFTKTEDFAGWATGRNDIEVMIGRYAYCMDYMITGKREVKAELSVMKPTMVDGRKMWLKCGVDSDLKIFIEDSICQILPIMFDELLDSEINTDLEAIEAFEDAMDMQSTYESLMQL